MQELIEQLLGYLRGMWERRWWGLAVAWAVAIIGAIAVFRLPDKYEASARVFVDTQSLLRPLLSGMAVAPDASQQVAILSRTLLSRPNVEKIIRKSDLDTAARMKADALVDDTLASLKITRAGGDNVYTIAFRYADGRKARDVVQAALAIFIEQSLGENRLDADTARKFLDQQIKDYEQKLGEAEARKQAFRLKYLGLLGTSGQSFLSQMDTVNDQIRAAKVEVRVAEQSRDGIRNQLKEQTAGGDVAPPTAEAPGAEAPEVEAPIAVPEIDARIDAQKRQLDELLRKYTDLHPDVVGIKRVLVQLGAERKKVVEIRRKEEAEARRKTALERPNAALSGDPIAQQLKVALNEAEANVTTARARLAEHEARHTQLRVAAESVPRIETELAQLDRDYNILKRQYEGLVERREKASLTTRMEESGVAEFRIIDPPRVTPNPVAPNRLLLLGALLGISLAAGLAMSFIVSQVRPTFHDGRSISEILGRPLLGMISALPSPELRHQLRRASFLFAGGVGGLLLTFGAALAITFLTTRAA